MSALTWETESVTPDAPDLTRCTNEGPHKPHRWHGKDCPGATPLAALTLPQIEAVANALGVSPWRIAPRLFEAYLAERG